MFCYSMFKFSLKSILANLVSNPQQAQYFFFEMKYFGEITREWGQKEKYKTQNISAIDIIFFGFKYISKYLFLTIF